jgi:hypothetical protein
MTRPAENVQSEQGPVDTPSDHWAIELKTIPTSYKDDRIPHRTGPITTHVHPSVNEGSLTARGWVTALINSKT